MTTPHDSGPRRIQPGDDLGAVFGTHTSSGDEVEGRVWAESEPRHAPRPAPPQQADPQQMGPQQMGHMPQAAWAPPATSSPTPTAPAHAGAPAMPPHPAPAFAAHPAPAFTPHPEPAGAPPPAHPDAAFATPVEVPAPPSALQQLGLSQCVAWSIVLGVAAILAAFYPAPPLNIVAAAVVALTGVVAGVVGLIIAPRTSRAWLCTAVGVVLCAIGVGVALSMVGPLTVLVGGV